MEFPKNALLKSYGVICLPGIGLAVFDRSMYIKSVVMREWPGWHISNHSGVLVMTITSQCVSSKKKHWPGNLI